MKIGQKQKIGEAIYFILLLFAGAYLMALIIEIVPEDVPEGEMITFFSSGAIQTAIDENRIPPEIGRQLLERMPPRHARIIFRWQGLHVYKEHPEKCSIYIDSDFAVSGH